MLPRLRKLEPRETVSRAFITLFKHPVDRDMPHYTELSLYLPSLVRELLESSTSPYSPQVPAQKDVPSFSKQMSERVMNELDGLVG